MRDPENPHETYAERGPVEIKTKSREEIILWTLRNSVETLERYGIGRKAGKYFVKDRARLNKILERQPDLREVLRKLWTEEA